MKRVSFAGVASREIHKVGGGGWFRIEDSSWHRCDVSEDVHDVVLYYVSTDRERSDRKGGTFSMSCNIIVLSRDVGGGIVV